MTLARGTLVAFVLVACAVTAACAAGVRDDAVSGQSTAALSTAPAGAIPAGLPPHLMVGLFENAGGTWMKGSGVPWDVRYAYFTYGWANNWGYGSHDGSWGLSFMKESAASGFIPAAEYYCVNGEPGGGESAFLSKVQNPATMGEYFSDFKLLMQAAKTFGKPVVILLEADGFGFLEQQSGDKSSAYAAVAASGVPELASLPNTVAGWGLAFLQLRKAVGASNAVLAIHVSAWAGGEDIAYGSVTDSLQPQVTKVYNFLSPFGLSPNQTGATYDVLVGDPLDRDSDYYKLVVGQNRWWDPSDTASVNSESFNRYAAWLGLWNVLAGKRWVLWQIPIGNSNHLDVCNNGKPRQGYKDNRAEYFFGTQGTTHSSAWAGDGVIGLLFGAGASCQSSYQNDQYTDGKPFLQNHVGSFYASGGLPLALGGSSGSDAGTDARSSSSSGGDGSNNAPTIAASASVSPTSVGTGATVTISATVTVTTGAMSNGIVDVEVYDPSGTKVGQDSISGQSLSMGQSKTYPYAWTAPATTGTFTVKVGVFGANWTPLYSWNGSAATIGVVAGDPAQYGFETGTQGWASAGSGIASVASSTAQAFAGGHSLAVNIAESGSGQPMVAVSSPSTPAGAVVTFHVFIPAGSGLTSVQPFALQGASGNWTWTGDWQAISSVKAGAWNTIQVTVPSNAATPLHELGVQFATSAAWTGTAYVDSVGW